MNNSQKLDLILDNQFHIMRFLWSSETSKVPMFAEGLQKQIEKTMFVLSAEESKLKESKELEKRREKIIAGSEMEDSKNE